MARRWGQDDAYKEATAFPFYLFNTVETTTDPLRPWTYRYGAPRGEYTTPPMGQPFSDEEGWWARTIEGYAGVLLFWDMTDKGSFTRRAPGTALGWWRACKQAVADVQAAGQAPIIVRATGVEPRWLFEWQWNQAGTRPADMTITQGPSPGASYDFHINGVPVFSCSAAGRATWVLGRELFESARFHRFPSGLTVEVGFEPDPDPWKGTLLVKLQHGAVRGAGPIWRIGHPAPTPPAPPPTAPTPSTPTTPPARRRRR